MNLLLMHGADLNARDNEGKRPVDRLRPNSVPWFKNRKWLEEQKEPEEQRLKQLKGQWLMRAKDEIAGPDAKEIIAALEESLFGTSEQQKQQQG